MRYEGIAIRWFVPISCPFGLGINNMRLLVTLLTFIEMTRIRPFSVNEPGMQAFDIQNRFQELAVP